MDVSRSTEVIVLIGTGAIGQAIARRIAPGKHLLLADLRESIAGQAGHMLPALGSEQDALLAQTPADELLALPMLQPDQVPDPGRAYMISKRANSLRVQSAAVQ